MLVCAEQHQACNLVPILALGVLRNSLHPGWVPITHGFVQGLYCSTSRVTHSVILLLFRICRWIPYVEFLDI